MRAALPSNSHPLSHYLRLQQGRGLAFDEDLAKKILTEDEVDIDITMSEGDESCTCWGCDITYDYIKINGDYRT